MSYAMRRLKTKRFTDSLRGNFVEQQVTLTAARVADGLLTVGGQFYSGSVPGEAGQVVNVGRPASALYAPQGGGGVVTVRVGGSTSGGGGGGGGLSAHNLNDTGIHLGPLDRAQAPWVADDISAAIATHAALPDVHHVRASAGDGIAVTGQQVRVLLAGDSGLIANPELRMGTPITLTSSTTNGVSGSGHSHAVTAYGSGEGNAGQLTKFDNDGGLSLTRLRTPLIDTASGNLSLQPVGNVMLQPAGTGVFMLAAKAIGSTVHVPGLLGSGWRISERDGIAGLSHLDIRSIYADELIVKSFIADMVRVRMGEDFLTYSMGIVTADNDGNNFIVPAENTSARLYIEDSPDVAGELFANNEWVMLSVLNRNGGGLVKAMIWGQVSGYQNEPDNRQSWLFTNRLGIAGLVIDPGAVALSFGTSGKGYIHRSVVDPDSPWTRYVTWSGANPYTPANRTVHVQIGNLNGINWDSALQPSGWGMYAQNVWMKGVVSAANDVVRLDNNGARIKTDPSTEFADVSAYRFMGHLDSTVIGGVYGRQSSNTQSVQVTVVGNATKRPVAALAAASAFNDATVFIGADRQGGGTANVTFDASATTGTVVFGATTHVRVNAPLLTGAIRATASNTYSIGEAGTPYHTIYVNNVVAQTITGSTSLGGEIWQYDTGDMFIRSNSAASRTLHVANPGAGLMHLNVEGNIVVGGLVDGVDVAFFQTTYNTHVGNANAHHNQAHTLAGVGGLGGDHTVSGLTTGMTLRASGSTTAAFTFLQHGDLAGVSPDQHHNQSHVLATTTALGNDHTVSGLTVGHVLQASAANNARFAALSHTHLTDVTPNQHHNQVHSITGSDHTISGSQFQLVGATGANTLGLLTPSANPGANAAILRTGNSGELTLRSLTVQGNVDVTNGGDLTVGANVLFVDVSGFNVGVNRAPDPQFDLDVLGNVRSGGWFVGRHAIQIDGAHMICHFDGAQPFATDHTGDPTGHMGQVADVSGPAIYRPGKFGTKAVQVGEGTTNLIPNPSFEGTYSSGIAPGWNAYSTGSGSGSRSSSAFALYGERAQRITRTGGAAGDRYGVSCSIASMSGTVMAGSVRIKVLSYSPGARVTLNVFRSAGQEIIAQRVITDADLNTWVDLLGAAATTTAATTRIVRIYIDQGNADILIDACQVEGKAYPTAYCDGSLPGHTWAGSPNASASSRGDASVRWHDIGGGLPVDHWTLMFWIYSYAPYGVVDNLHTINLSDGSDDNRLFLYHSSAAPGSFRVGYTTGGSTTFSNMSGNVMEAGRWHHVTAVYGGGTLLFYLDGVQVSSVIRTPMPIPLSRLAIGARYISPLNHGPTSLFDDIILVDRVVPAAEVRAIYESDAPVFAESSTHQFRVGNGLVWGDAEGLFARDIDGNAIFAVVGVDGKSWGGVTLDKGDLLIGNAVAGYVQYDRSAQRIGLVDTDLTLLYGGSAWNKIKFNKSGTVVGEIFANSGPAGSDLQIWARAESGLVTTNVLIGTTDHLGGNLKYFGMVGTVFNVMASSNFGGGSVTMPHQLTVRNSIVGYKGSAGGDPPLWVHLRRISTTLPAPSTEGFVRFDQDDASGGLAPLALRQADLSNALIAFQSSFGTTNPLSTAALGTYYAKARVAVNGVLKWIAIYN